jgi:hypothetical protein
VVAEPWPETVARLRCSRHFLPQRAGAIIINGYRFVFDTTRQNNAVNRTCHNDHIGKCSSGVDGYSVTHATSLLLDPNAIGDAAIVNARTVPEVRADVDTP